jgi:hypothetical protein
VVITQSAELVIAADQLSRHIKIRTTPYGGAEVPAPPFPRTRARPATPGLPARQIRTATNTEAKLLMLTHAFAMWKVNRACFQTDARNQFEGCARASSREVRGDSPTHRMTADCIARDSCCYSIVARSGQP